MGTPTPFQRLLDRTHKKNIPLICTFELTHACNLSCRHCYIPDAQRKRGHSRGLTTAEVKRTLRSLAHAGTLSVAFTGGEIFLRPDLLEIVEYARKLAFEVRLFTNGTLIPRSAMPALARLGVSGVEMSLYGRMRTHDLVTRTPGSFRKTKEAIIALRTAGVPVALKSPLMRDTFKDRAWLESFAKQHGARIKYDPVIAPRNDGDKGVLRYRITKAQMERLFRAESPDSFTGPEGENKTDLFCGAGHNMAGIGSDGTVYPCLQALLPLGSVKRTPFKKIWSNSNAKLRAYRSIGLPDLHTCPSCRYRAFCQRCPGLALLEDGDLLGPSTVACAAAAAKLAR